MVARREQMNPIQIEELFRYPETYWGQLVSERWTALCDGLRGYEAPYRSLEIARERKWELVSAYQKSVRRGDAGMALRCVSAMPSLPKEWLYFWRRICTTVCEDVGPCDPELCRFVIAITEKYPPRALGEQNYQAACFVTQEMGLLPNRSRVGCSCAIIEEAAMKSELFDLPPEDKLIVSAITRQKRVVQAAENLWHTWQKKNDWRSDGMLKFLGLEFPLEATTVEEPIPPSVVLYDLPAYAFDMHTRVGLKMLHRMVRGVAGAEAIRSFFERNKMREPHKALGMALFFLEGGRIKGELICGPLAGLEQRYFAHNNGLPLNRWFDLRALVEEALAKGIIDRVREEVLQQVYGQMLLGLI